MFSEVASESVGQRINNIGLVQKIMCLGNTFDRSFNQVVRLTASKRNKKSSKPVTLP